MTDRERYYAEPHRERLSFVKWINYFFFVGSCITPMNEYRDFEDFINYRGNITKMPKYGNIWPACKRFGETLLCLVLFSIVHELIDVKYMLTPEFAAENIAFKVFFLILSMHEMIFRLFVAFGGIESNLIATGLSYRPRTEKEPEEYNQYRAIEMIGFETALNGAQSATRWNCFTNRWLKYYVQMRLMDRT